ncbi:hypothetical protein SEA_MABODAMACA_59 [Microbacterium phage Mabodamaca]|uniref:Uncharacterized protein n=1 Tax=Microbacterium phage Mabodamaca TaxID=3078574 RepID=A0AA96NEF4_9CAUD|nr:hypothetical protein SEA_MABODAMACA_59 [Microbacterium phage Mabodamaca]
MALSLPIADEARVERLLSRALVRDDDVVLDDGAPVDVFEAARRLGFEGRLRVIPDSRMVRVLR